MKTKFRRFPLVNSGPLSTVLKNLTLSVWKYKEQPYSHNRLFQWWHGSALTLVWLWTWICTSIHAQAPVLPLLQSVPCLHSWSWCSCQSSLWWQKQGGGYCSPGTWRILPDLSPRRANKGQPTFPVDKESERLSDTNTAKPPSNILWSQVTPCPVLEVAQSEHTTQSLV